MDLDAIKQQIESYRDKYRGDPDIQIMLTVLGQMISEVERLKAENERQHADLMRIMQALIETEQEVEKLKVENAELKAVLQRVQQWGADARSADSYELFRDVKLVLGSLGPEKVVDCTCVPCICENPDRCLGCGARMCLAHELLLNSSSRP